jgi:hypothetical protein
MTNRYDKFIQPAEGIVVLSSGRSDAVPGNPIMGIIQSDWRRIVGKIRPIFKETAQRFDEAKFPPDVYQKVLAAFEEPALVSAGTLREALLWKYGHLRKRGRIPGAHESLIRQVQQAWPRLARNLPRDPQQAFAVIAGGVGGPTRFITVAFLVHLSSQDRVPIIDQHNFRAVNSFVRDVRPPTRVKKKPSTWSDIALVSGFMDAVLAEWARQDQASTPTRRRLDQFLMRYGKDLKESAA